MALGFLTNKEAREQITGLETRVSELESELSAANESLTAAQNDLATANESLSEAQCDLANAKDRIAELETENAKIPGLQAAAQVTTEKVGLKAAELAATVGLTEALSDAAAGNENNSRTPHLDKFESLKGSDATAYFKEHKKAINAEARLR
jgi:chromosome segregation ATPase